MNNTQTKRLTEKAPKQGQYATAEEAIDAKNKPTVALLKKLNVKVVPAPDKQSAG